MLEKKEFKTNEELISYLVANKIILAPNLEIEDEHTSVLIVDKIFHLDNKTAIHLS